GVGGNTLIDTRAGLSGGNVVADAAFGGITVLNKEAPPYGYSGPTIETSGDLKSGNISLTSGNLRLDGALKTSSAGAAGSVSLSAISGSVNFQRSTALGLSIDTSSVAANGGDVQILVGLGGTAAAGSGLINTYTAGGVTTASQSGVGGSVRISVL